MPPETENEPVTPAGTSAENFASSPAATPVRSGVATPFTNVKSVMSTETVPSSGKTSVPEERSKNAFWAGLRIAPALSVRVEASPMVTAFSRMPPAFTTIG